MKCLPCLLVLAAVGGTGLTFPRQPGVPDKDRQGNLTKIERVFSIGRGPATPCDRRVPGTTR
jgi:hypothetical protein